mmetsp:Transcript_19364/g.46617  ORF Transcript_19364/g.46617 Transcript_19364/m.46617 type:complete len:394 (+) Transcript_19364:23-1204(+)
MSSGVVLVRPAVQKYAWGVPGSHSQVAELASLGGHPDPVQPDEPYAELWMGAHPGGVNHVVEEGVATPLPQWLAAHPEFGAAAIPYLLKVLAVAKPLSIQAHPDKALAERLHQEKPHMYPDDNHKPEIAICTSDRHEVLCGFRPLDQIRASCEEVPELRGLIGEELLAALAPGDNEVSALKAVYTKIMTTDGATVAAAVQAFLGRTKGPPEPNVALAHRLNEHFPGDVGVFMAFFMNLVELKKGEGLLMPANTPHAHLLGTCMECMANSDNVVRGGLTPKAKDVEVLCEMLEYKAGSPADYFVEPKPVPGGVEYVPAGYTDFSVLCLRAEPGAPLQSTWSTEGPSIALVAGGCGRVGDVAVSRGSVLLVKPGLQVDMVADESLEVFVARQGQP